jgi:hypothetical protein
MAAAKGEPVMDLGRDVHLTYCSNVHPGEAWEEIEANLQKYIPLVRSRVAPGKRFGIGLRLSAQAADTLARPGHLAALKRFLNDNDCYIFTFNGFPYGTFHGKRVKEAVYLPDWRNAERLRYTNVLAGLMAELLPRQAGLQGSISTVPGAYKSEIHSESDIRAMRENLIRHVAHLVEIERNTGQRIQLALEPEPCCFLETIEEAVDFFERELFSLAAAEQLIVLTGMGRGQAQEALHLHLGLCLDLCHAAVEFEHVEACLSRLAKADIGIFKMQVSAGLKITHFIPEVIRALKSYVDPVYLHQVVERTHAGLRRFTDLPDALASLDSEQPPEEWRVHFHVPVFYDRLGPFHSTRDFIEEMLARHRKEPLSRHLEVETYTWDVLPAALKEQSVDQAIARELNWTLEVLCS